MAKTQHIIPAQRVVLAQPPCVKLNVIEINLCANQMTQLGCVLKILMAYQHQHLDVTLTKLID